MARLTSAQRNRLPASAFAGPNRSYPIEDASHARNALARVSQFGSPAEKAKVRAKVRKRFPKIGTKERDEKIASFVGKRKPGEVSDVRSSNPKMGRYKPKGGYAIPYSQDTNRSPYRRGGR